jgi:TRAP-type transport system periplasmic protein
MTMLARPAALLSVVALAAGLAAGCGRRPPEAADKAGGTPRHGLVLRLAVAYDSSSDASAANYFATQVERLSQRKVRVDVVVDAGGGDDDPFAEIHVARLVRAGNFDLGWIGARAWDEVGANSFQALQAPFLITSYPVLERVVKSKMATQMLAGLASVHVRGLALIPGLLRHPASEERPLVSQHDFAGARIRVQPSRASDALFRALGAVPVHVEGDGTAASTAFERLDGHETSIADPPVSSIVSANVTFFPKVVTLFANEHVFSSLSREQRRILEAAARRTTAHSANFPLRQALGYEGVLARWYCKHTPGRVALAGEGELRGLVRATRPVYVQLERDLQTRKFINEIRRIKASLPAPPPVSVPTGCLQPRQPRAVGAVRSPSLLNGTYHWRLTKAAALAFGPPASSNADHTHFPIINAVVLRDGRAMTIEYPRMLGSYAVTGDHLTLLWKAFGYPLTFRFTADPSGTLHLRAVQPMDRGDEFVWSGGPWRRVGPPVVSIP